MKAVFRIGVLRNILIISLLISIVLPVSVKMFVFPTFVDLENKEIEKESVRIAKYLMSISVEDIDFSDKLPKNLETIMFEAVRNLNLMKIKFFTAKGRTIFSTDIQDKEKMNTHSYFKEVVAKGRTFSKVVKKHTKSQEGQIIPIDVAETYVPFMDKGHFMGAFEIYYDITGRYKLLNDILATYWKMLLFGIFILMSVIIVSLQKAGKHIIERKQAEERYRTLFEGAKDAIFILDVEDNPGKIIDANKAAAEMHMYSHEELLTLNIRDLDAEHDKEKVAERTAQIMKGNWVSSEIGHIKKDGTTFTVEVHAGLIETGDQKFILAIDRDVTKRKTAEEEKLKLESQLRQASKMEAIGTLAGGIAHDFNNILSAVIGYTELALGDVNNGTLQYENLQQVLIAGDRAKNLVQQILTFSRQADQEQMPVQVKLVVREALKLLRASIPTTIKIEQNIQSNALVMGDSTQIHQVLMNLCTNAAHSMEDKGGLLTVNLSDAELDSEFISNHPDFKPGQYVNLTVSDTGHGMSPAVLDKIFDPFFTTKEKGEGTGMGLSVVHGIVHSHGGTINAYSEHGNGSTFKVFFPAIEKRLKPEDRIERSIPAGTEHILFIDDEPTIVNMGKQILESLGYDVVTRTSSIEALELFKAQKDRFDIVITDLTMPQMTGENLAKELMSIRSDIPVILCTGFSARMDKKKAMDMGIRAFVLKPILKREIAEIIRAVLDG